MPVATSSEAHAEMTKFLAAGDQAGLAGMMVSRDIAFVDCGTTGLVLAYHGNPFLGNLIIESRVLDGRYRGQKAFVSVTHTKRAAASADLEVPESPAESVKVEPKPAVASDPEEDRREKRLDEALDGLEEALKEERLAETLMKSAANLERAGKTSGALDFYRRVSRDFPKTPSAKIAADRIKALSK